MYSESAQNGLVLQYNCAGAALQVSLDLFLHLLSFQIKCICVASTSWTMQLYSPAKALREDKEKKKKNISSKGSGPAQKKHKYKEVVLGRLPDVNVKLDAAKNKQRARRCCCNHGGLLWMIYGTLKWNYLDQIQEHVVGWLLRLKHLHTDSHQDTEVLLLCVCVCVCVHLTLTD